MTNQEILEKAIQKALDGGWKMVTPDDATRIKNPDPLKDVIEYWDLDWKEGAYAYFHIFFDHDFAKALWGSEPIINGIRLEHEWEKHLQQMVIADDPIKYLGENI